MVGVGADDSGSTTGERSVVSRVATGWVGSTVADWASRIAVGSVSPTGAGDPVFIPGGKTLTVGGRGLVTSTSRVGSVRVDRSGIVLPGDSGGRETTGWPIGLLSTEPKSGIECGPTDVGRGPVDVSRGELSALSVDAEWLTCDDWVVDAACTPESTDGVDGDRRSVGVSWPVGATG